MTTKWPFSDRGQGIWCAKDLRELSSGGAVMQDVDEFSVTLAYLESHDFRLRCEEQPVSPPATELRKLVAAAPSETNSTQSGMRSVSQAVNFNSVEDSL